MNINIKGGFWTIGIIFVILKLCDVIEWSWWLVCIPFYIPITLILLACTLWVIGSILKEQGK